MFKKKKNYSSAVLSSRGEGPTRALLSECVFLRGDKIRHSFQSPVVKARQHMDQAAEGNKQQLYVCGKKRGRENE